MYILDLDFRKTRPASPWARWVLLALAIAFMSDLAVSYYGVRKAITHNEQRLAQLGRSMDGATRAALTSRAPSPEEIRLARDTIERLAMPWDNLFGALEATASDKVALLAIEPDPKSGTVLISGEAIDYPAALDYVSQLGRARALDRAHLVRHERQQDAPQQPVTFSISATWSKAK
ncbi:MAG: hypothetical protein HY527_09305 [Betaproteobacteria bacterium]|nr:hypothetical protein [Betaproteobacteria bacterium]